MMAYTCVRVLFEIGHEAVVRDKKTSEGYTHNWELFIRGADNTDIQHFVDKVVFHLHETFPNPRRAVKEPPYSIRETGYAGFDVIVEVYLKNKPPAEPNKIRFSYFLVLQEVGQPPLSKVVKEKYVFSNPNEDFRRKLLKGGGVGVNAESSSSIHSSHMAALNFSHSMDERKSSIVKNKSPTEVPLKKSKKDSTPKQEELVNQNEFSMLFGQPIIKNKIPYSITTSKSSSKPISDKISQSSEKQAHSSSKTSKHNSSLHKDKDKDKEKERDKDKDKDREKEKSKERDKEKDKNSVKKNKDDSMKKEKSKDDKEKILKSSKEESKKNSYHEDKSKEKEKSVEKFDKEIKLDKKDKEKKHKDEKKLKSKQKYKDNENKKENLAVHENYPGERIVDKASALTKDLTAATLIIKKEEREERSHEKVDKISKEKSVGGEPKSLYNSGSVDGVGVNNASVTNAFDTSKKDEKHKHHKHKKDKSKKVSKRDKEEKKEKSKEPKESKEKQPGPAHAPLEQPKSTPKSDSPRRKTPLKKLFDDLIENSDSDVSSLNEDVKTTRGSSSSPDVTPPIKMEPRGFHQLEEQTKEADKLDTNSNKKKSKKSAEEKESKKRKRKSKYKDEESLVKSSKYSHSENATAIKQNSILDVQDSTTNNSVESTRQAILPAVSESKFTDEYVTKLKELQRKIMTLEDHSGLQRIVQVVAETGQYEITTKTFDFDLCTLDESIVQRLLDFFVP